MSTDFLCAACVASSDDRQHAAFNSRWAVTIYRGNALCIEHFEEVRKTEQTRKSAAAK